MQEFYLSTSDSLAEVFQKISPSDEGIHIILKDGEHKGLFHERIFYNLPNPLVKKS